VDRRDGGKEEKNETANNDWFMNPGILGSDPEVIHLVFQLRNLALLTRSL
jgi:hypothetical protein